MVEIGGYFGLDDFQGIEFYPELHALNTGRNALAVLIKARRIKKLYIPAYLCDSVYRICEREGCSYNFYEIGEEFHPLVDFSLNDGEWLYVVNYFGQIKNEIELKKRYKNIIFDNVQSFFQKPVEGIDTIYSCRKFFGVPDGAYLASSIEMVLPVDVSKERMAHILGRYEGTASEFYAFFTENDESFYNLEPKLMSKLTHNILKAIDYEAVKRKREENFRYLHYKLKDRNKLNITVPSGPYMYPLYVENGSVIRRRLALKKIYIPTLWPTAIEYGGLAKDYSENILPLPCDQRYTINDMQRIVDELILQSITR